jgi:hypothetical protein
MTAVCVPRVDQNLAPEYSPRLETPGSFRLAPRRVRSMTGRVSKTRRQTRNGLSGWERPFHATFYSAESQAGN